MMFALKLFVSKIKLFKPLQHVLDNDPVILMVGQTMLKEEMKKRAVTRQDICSKLRVANVTHPDQIFAVVLETTGDISIVWSDQDRLDVDYHIFSGTTNQQVLREHPLPERFCLTQGDAFDP